jgi:hypothetical protein
MKNVADRVCEPGRPARRSWLVGAVRPGSTAGEPAEAILERAHAAARIEHNRAGSGSDSGLP